jgi:hypothetical protein
MIYEGKKQSYMFKILVPIGWTILIRKAQTEIIRIKMTALTKDGLIWFSICARVRPCGSSVSDVAIPKRLGVRHPMAHLRGCPKSEFGQPRSSK